MALNNSVSNIPVEVFATYIVEKLRRTNPHLNLSFDESTFVLQGAVVHIPQAGKSPEVVKNRKSFPATAVMRGDSDITYALDVFSTDPTHITWHESNEISYNKTDSVLGDHVHTLIEHIGDNMLYNWIHGLKRQGGGFVSSIIPTTNRLKTTGDMASVNPNDGQTGQRRAFSYKDLSRAQSVMNKQNVPAVGRYAILESYMYQQFVDSLSDNQMAAFQQSADLRNGVVGRLYGFSIMERSSVLAFAANGDPLLPEEALSGDSNLAALCWQESCVTRAQGDIKPFQEIDSPTYYGDIFSALVKFGGRARRENWEGVLTIEQSAT